MSIHSETKAMLDRALDYIRSQMGNEALSTGEIAAHALASPASPMSLRPLKADIRVDRKYILAAMGLLSEYAPSAALRIMKKELEYNGYLEQTNS